MRIVLVGPVYPYRGGISQYTMLLDTALRRQSNEVWLVSFKRQYPRFLFPGKSDLDPSHVQFGASDTSYLIDSLNPFSWIYTYWQIRKFHPDLIVLQWWTTYWSIVWYSITLLNRIRDRTPITFICHNVLPHDSSRIGRWLTRFTLRNGQRFIVQSAKAREQLQQLLGNVSIVRVPHPVVELSSATHMDRSQAQAELNLLGHFPVLLFFGFIRKYKNLMLIIDALPLIRKYMPNVHLVIAGEFWIDKEEYLNKIELLDLPSNVTIDDRYIPNEEIARYFYAADALIAPYPHDGGSAVTQMAAGIALPVLPISESGNNSDSMDAIRLSEEVIDYFLSRHIPITPTQNSVTWDELASILTNQRFE